MANEISVKAAPAGFWDYLSLLFIGLKLCGVINWYWLWVLAPALFLPTVGVCLNLLNKKMRSS